MPLSHTDVISRLNRYFVPVYLSNEDYRDTGSAPPEEKAELRRIHAEGHAAKLSVGSVHAYVLSPDGRLMDSLHVAEAFKVEKLVAMLDRTTGKLGTQPGEPVVKPAPQSVARAEPGSLLLHVTARYLERKGDEYVLVEGAGGNWSAFPGEAWITLSGTELAGLLPPGAVRAGESWELGRDTAARILDHFYPPTENNDLSKNRIEEQSLKGTVLSVQDGVARARIEGGLKMKHPFYHRDDDNRVEAKVVGYLEFEPGTRRVRSLQLVTEDAVYGSAAGRKQPFGVAVRLER